LYVVPGLGKRKLRALQAQHIREWLNGLRTTCQCCAQGKGTERAMKGKARCCAKKPAECCGQVAGTGTLRYLLRLVRAALQDAVEEELLARNVARQVKMPAGSIRKVRLGRRMKLARFSKLHDTTGSTRCGRSRWQSVSGVGRRLGFDGSTWT
jgi:hypothetical protein